MTANNKTQTALYYYITISIFCCVFVLKKKQNGSKIYTWGLAASCTLLHPSSSCCTHQDRVLISLSDNLHLVYLGLLDWWYVVHFSSYSTSLAHTITDLTLAGQE